MSLDDRKHFSTTKLEHAAFLCFPITAAVFAPPLWIVPIATPAMITALDHGFIAIIGALAVLRTFITPWSLHTTVAAILHATRKIAKSIVEADMVVRAAHRRTIVTWIDVYGRITVGIVAGGVVGEDC